MYCKKITGILPIVIAWLIYVSPKLFKLLGSYFPDNVSYCC